MSPRVSFHSVETVTADQYRHSNSRTGLMGATRIGERMNLDKLTTATAELHEAEELIDAALGRLKKLDTDSPWLTERITELLNVSDQLGDAMGSLDDMLNLVTEGSSDG